MSVSVQNHGRSPELAILLAILAGSLCGGCQPGAISGGFSLPSLDRPTQPIVVQLNAVGSFVDPDLADSARRVTSNSIRLGIEVQ
jgi:hypothetical protein